MTKFQDENQLKGRFGELLASFAFPPEWVVRPIQHDYGLDLELEVFHAVPSESGKPKYQTWGEHLYLQVKTTDKLTFSTYEEAEDVPDVLNFSIEISELKLVEALGASVPVVLLVVDRIEMKVFYVCLNDYISKSWQSANPAGETARTSPCTFRSETKSGSLTKSSIRHRTGDTSPGSRKEAKSTVPPILHTTIQKSSGTR